MKQVISYLIAATLFISIVGICNGLASFSNSCSGQYLDLRKPINYIMFPHTAGYYLGRTLGFPHGEKASESYCSTIFNQTLRGPRSDFE